MNHLCEKLDQYLIFFLFFTDKSYIGLKQLYGRLSMKLILNYGKDRTYSPTKLFESPSGYDETGAVNGNLEIRGMNGQELPAGLVVRGDLIISDYELKALPEVLTVQGSLVINMSSITALGGITKIGRHLIIKNSPLESLPEKLKVGKGIKLENTRLKQFPSSLKRVNGSFSIINTPLSCLPKDLKVGGCLHIGARTALSELPEGLNVKAKVLLRESEIIRIPRKVYIGSDLRLPIKCIAEIHEDAVIKGSIFGEFTLTNNSKDFILRIWDDS